MDIKQFNAIIPFIVQDLVSLIIEKQNIDFEKALDVLYNSKLYENLIAEETKNWHLSSEKLYEMLNFEMQTGKEMTVEYH